MGEREREESFGGGVGEGERKGGRVR